MLSAQHKHAMLGVELGEDARAFGQHAPELGDRPADRISMIAGCRAIINHPILDLVKPVPCKQQIAHAPRLPSHPPTAQWDTHAAESASSGKLLINLGLVQNGPAATAWGLAA